MWNALSVARRFHFCGPGRDQTGTRVVYGLHPITDLTPLLFIPRGSFFECHDHLSTGSNDVNGAFVTRLFAAPKRSIFVHIVQETSVVMSPRSLKSATFFSVNPYIFLIAGLIVMAGACRGTDAEQDASGEVEAQPVHNGQFTPLEKTQVVLRSQEDFEHFWEQLHASTSPPPERPHVNFAAQAVVAIVLGERNTGGYDVAVKEVTRSDDGTRVNVHVRETKPGDDCMVSAVLTSPYVLVAIENPGDEVTVSQSVTTRSC